MSATESTHLEEQAPRNEHEQQYIAAMTTTNDDDNTTNHEDNYKGESAAEQATNLVGR